MDFKQLRSLVAVADCGSFTQAAQTLYTSQPTVSAHIRQLEEELHQQLFLRTTKSLTITPRGRELYDYAVHVLRLQEQLTSRWANDESVIQLGASTIPSAYILPEVLPAFRRQQPDEVSFSIHQGDSGAILSELRDGRFDLGLVGMAEAEGELCFVPFYRDRMVLITPPLPRFAAMGPEDVLDILRREPLLLRHGSSGSRKCADAFLSAAKLELRQLHVTARLNDQESVKNLVAGGLGVSIVSGKAVENDVRLGRLLAFPLPELTAARSLYLVWRRDDFHKSAARHFADFVLHFYHAAPPTD